MSIFVEERYSRIGLTGKLINYNRKPRQASFLDGGPHPMGSIYAGGLQRGRALKTCHSEFHHITGAAFFILENFVILSILS